MSAVLSQINEADRSDARKRVVKLRGGRAGCWGWGDEGGESYEDTGSTKAEPLPSTTPVNCSMDLRPGHA